MLLRGYFFLLFFRRGGRRIKPGDGRIASTRGRDRSRRAGGGPAPVREMRRHNVAKFGEPPLFFLFLSEIVLKMAAKLFGPDREKGADDI